MRATQHIVQSITRAIAERRLMPGTKLTEQKLCEHFSVSRTLVRQALNQLSRDRLVTLLPGRGAFVTTPTIEEAHQVFEVRAMLEATITNDLCQRITPVQILALKAHLSRERHALKDKDIAMRTRLLGQFHGLLADMHGNRVLAAILSDLLLRSSLIALMYQSTHSAQESHNEHVTLVQALESGNAKLATDLMRQHLHHVRSNLKLDPLDIRTNTDLPVTDQLSDIDHAPLAL